MGESNNVKLRASTDFCSPADFGVQIVPFRVSHMVAAGNGQMMSCAREFLHFFLPKHGRSGNKRKSNGFEMGAPGIGISCGNKPSSLSVLLKERAIHDTCSSHDVKK